MDHQWLMARLDRAVAATSCYIDLNCCYDCQMRYALLDSVRMTALRHAPFRDVLGIPQCQHESIGEYVPWPCPDVQQAIETLKWLEQLDG